MGSVGFEFDADVASQPSTSNHNKYRLPIELRDCRGEINRASVPRKLRSVSKRQCHLSNRTDTFKKQGKKKSMLKKGHVTKDEEEVAETLYALANIVTGSDEPKDMKSSIVVETERSMTARLPAWLRCTNFISKATIIGDSINTEKCSPVVVKSSKTWKRCSAHVYISRLIKVLQMSERRETSATKEMLQEQVPQHLTCSTVNSSFMGGY